MRAKHRVGHNPEIPRDVAGHTSLLRHQMLHWELHIGPTPPRLPMAPCRPPTLVDLEEVSRVETVPLALANVYREKNVNF